MTVPHTHIRWRKSTRSQDQGDCVELGNAGHTGLVRDSKNSAGPALAADLRQLVSAVKANRIR